MPLKSFFIASLLLLTSSCGYYREIESEPNSGGGQILGSGQKLGFEVVQSILQSNRCLDCHSAAGGNRANVNLETYTSTKSQADSILSTTKSGAMPLGGPKISDKDFGILEAWVAAGAPEVSELPLPGEPPVEPARVTFTEIQAQIFSPHCVRCHSGFSGYAQVAASLGAIRSAIDSNRMPRNAPPLDSNLKLMLAQWIEAGAPEH